ncbi:hypothetical protein HaLaN_15076 [Haematococcus lacustris]|uniref:Uncharacterized protein n=1 Tax=Haematococcus lacustris TaxID=44745 RepID=A0A699Z808_HAELA|nr:hypothetical protein HaLaN_15076 [Haematococcus lacustris]
MQRSNQDPFHTGSLKLGVLLKALSTVHNLTVTHKSPYHAASSYLLSSPCAIVAALPPTPLQARSGAMRTCQLLLVLLVCLSSLTQATLHDRARGLRSQGVSEEDIARYKHHHSSNAGIHRQRPEYKEALKLTPMQLTPLKLFWLHP